MSLVSYIGRQIFTTGATWEALTGPGVSRLLTISVAMALSLWNPTLLRD